MYTELRLKRKQEADKSLQEMETVGYFLFRRHLILYVIELHIFWQVFCIISMYDFL